MCSNIGTYNKRRGKKREPYEDDVRLPKTPRGYHRLPFMHSIT